MQVMPDLSWFVATAIAVMQPTDTLDPPGGATALIAVIGREPIQHLGYLYTIVPVTVGAFLSELIYVVQFRVLNASGSESALGILEQYPDVKLVLTDLETSDIDGRQFCQKIRENHALEDLAIVGFVSCADRSSGIKFLKSGASDYVIKDPFLVEEFYAKINRALEMVNLYSLLRSKTS